MGRAQGPARVLVRLLALVLVVVGLWVSAPALAQSSQVEPPDYARWAILAAAAERRTESAATREATLNLIRSQVVEMRAQFVAARDHQRQRIATLREQIAALGPPPAEGVTEAPEITARRAELAQLLATREAPLLAAEEALTRAEAIVRGIDRVLRERQAQALTRVWPLPMNPANWPVATDALISSLLTVWGETYNSWLNPEIRAGFWSSLPVVILFLGVALGLLARGRQWMESLTVQLLRSSTLLRGRFVAAFFLSLTQIVIPFFGLSLLVLALERTGLGGTTVTDMVAQIGEGGLLLILVRWLSLHLFPIVYDPGLILRLDKAARKQARIAALLVAGVSAWGLIFTALIQPSVQSDAAVSVLFFHVIVLQGLAMWRLGRILARHSLSPERLDPTTPVSGPSFVDRTIWIGAKLLMFVAVAAPVLAAFGYFGGANQLIYPAAESLGLIGLILVLQRLVTAIYEAALGLPEGTSNALVPALAGLMLTAIALPVLSLIWGARSTDLWELYNWISGGFELGGARLSPTTILWFLVVFAIGYMITRALQGALGTSVLPKTSLERGAQKAIVSGVGYVGIIAATLVAFSVAGINLSGLAIVAGALSVGIGFGLQNIVSNFVSGIILLIERPVSEGDWVQVGQTSGIIERISVRSTMIQTFDRSKVIVPNADLISGAVTNFTKSSKTGRVIVPVGVAYGSDTRKVESVLREIVEAEPLVMLDPAPSVLFVRFGADALEFEVRAILRDVNFKMSVASNINHKIAARFVEEGIEIPYAQRDIWIRNPEALTGRPTGGQPQGPAGAALTQPQPLADRDTDSAAEDHDDTDPEFREATR